MQLKKFWNTSSTSYYAQNYLTLHLQTPTKRASDYFTFLENLEIILNKISKLSLNPLLYVEIQYWFSERIHEKGVSEFTSFF